MCVPPVDFVLILAPILWRPYQIHAVVTMAVLGVFLLSGGGRYRARLHLSVLDELPTILARLLTAAAAVALVIAMLYPQEAVLRFLNTACFSIALVVAGRVFTTQLIALGRRTGITRHHTVCIGGGPLAAELTKILAEHREYGLAVDGFVDEGEDHFAQEEVPRLGSLRDLDAAVLATGADVLLIADGNFQERVLLDAVRSSVCQRADLLIVPRMHHFHTQTGMADHIGSIPVMRIRTPNLRGPSRLIKRLFDIVIALTAAVLVLPLMVSAAIAVRLEGGPGILFRQTRIGRDGKRFEVLKFRTMKPANERESETNWCVATDPRVGRVGKFLRRTSIDELPQLWNIIRGDMTLVGPRPERPYFVEQFSQQFDRYAHRHRVQAGLTGLAQVSGLRGNTSIADRARYDNFYIENWSLWLDMKIILRTFSEVVFHGGR
ncbi:sugar transferase [Mycobacterium parmense]|uniref:UDP-phosphate galactose phosphotransferase n=1 Tax=Mycobacterium parmense TaxID=185642 RepID=A0A7I7Z3L2_9MYCO|nr:sugar transferase [Mycobacterium parmense]ORW56399.1 polyprenyl glycosylphosphotransferase [Mycobacterium parmense]BBZ48187.1 UDP-phosphate galactose phosphotransferase [Mycobacterium parmense]